MDRKEALKQIRQWSLPRETREVLEVLIPELRESDGEKIRKGLLTAFQKMNGWWNGMLVSGILAWLEKQKEQKPASTEDMPHITYEHFFKREPADSFKYKLAEYMTKCCTKKEGPYGYEYGISAETILEMAKEELIKRGELKEQKSAEWSEKHIAYIFEKVGLAKIAREQGNDELTNALQDAMLELSKVENAEWSEEDKEMLQ